MKILACHDGSVQAEKALRLASAIAAACEAKVAILGVTENPGETETILSALKKGKQILDGQKIECELVNKSGRPIAEISKWTEEVQYDLVVIGAVRKEIRGAFWMSLKAYEIVKSIKPPVLVVMGDTASINSMLICSGGKRYIENAVAFSGELARCLKAKVSLLHVLPETPAIYQEFRREEVNVTLVLNSNSELGRNLRQEKQNLEALGVPVEVKLRQGAVVYEIFDEIGSGDYDLIVTGSAPSGGPLQTYMLGDVTREILNRADRPVLIVRSDAPTLSIGSLLKRVFHRLMEDKVPTETTNHSGSRPA